MSELIRLDRLLSNRGYASRAEVISLIRKGSIEVDGKRPSRPDARVEPEKVLFQGQALDPGPGLVVLMHKPVGYICSKSAEGPSVFELLPARWLKRKPPLNCVGRLDLDASGLLLFCDDGRLLRRLTAPRHRIAKIYEVELAADLKGGEAELFSAGQLLLKGEVKPCLPAKLEVISARRARLTLYEGRYHQVKRMFGAVGNAVISLHRSQLGGLRLAELAAGAQRLLDQAEIQMLQAPTPAE